MARVQSPVLIGRREELAALADAIDGIRTDGRARVVVVAGEAGIGKTRLVSEALAARPAGIATALGRCLDVGGSLPYAPYLEILRDLGQAAGADRPSGLPPPFGGDEAAPADGDEEIARGRLFNAILERLRPTAGALVLVVEDLHWADRASLELTRYLAWNLRDEPVLLVLTTRTDEAPRDPVRDELLLALERDGGVVRVSPDRLTREQVRAQLEAIGGSPASAQLVASIHRRSGGNPYLAEELTALSAGGDMVGLPPTPRDIVLARAASLDPMARRLAAAVAVGGPWVDSSALAAVVETDPSELRHAIDEAVAAALLVRGEGQEVERVGFRHELAREAVASDLLGVERRAWHARWAEVLVERGAAAPGTHAAIAAHLDAAGRPVDALPYHLAAADEALGGLAFETAAREYERVFAILEAGDIAADAVPDLVELSGKAARALRFAGRTDAALERVQATLAWIAEEDVVARAAAYERIGTFRTEIGDHDGALEATAHAVELLAAGPPEARARAMIAHVMTRLHVTDVSGVDELIDAALAIADAERLPVVESLALSQRGLVRVLTGDPSGARADLDRAWALALSTGDVEAILLVALDRPLASFALGDLEEATERGLEGVAAVERIGAIGSFDASGIQLNAAEGLILLGRWAEAEVLLGRADAADPLGAVRQETIISRARLAAWRGDLTEAQAMLDRSFVSLGPQLAAFHVAIVADHARLSGRFRDALRLATDGLPIAVPLGNLTALLQRAALADAGLAAAVAQGRLGPLRADERAAVTALAESVAIAREALRSTELYGEAAGYLEQVAAWTTALAGDPVSGSWAAVADRWASIGIPYLEGWARFYQAEALLLEHGPRALAETSAARAADLAQRLGAQRLADEVVALARRGRLELGTASSADGTMRRARSALELTARERQVLELIVDGRTNRQIGEALFISPKTAGVHVSNVLGKLGVRGRVEAATAAIGLGLVEK